MYVALKGRNKTVPICKWHGYLLRESQGIKQKNKLKTPGTNK